VPRTLTAAALCVGGGGKNVASQKRAKRSPRFNSFSGQAEGSISPVERSGEQAMAQTSPIFTLPQQILLEFHEVEPPLDGNVRRIKIGYTDPITSSDRLCVVEIHDM
jgi:hypothetical protein